MEVINRPQLQSLCESASSKAAGLNKLIRDLANSYILCIELLYYCM